MVMIEEAESLVGRPIEVAPTTDGMFIVEWFNYNAPPPPKGNTPQEAIDLFVSHVAKLKEENPDAVEDRSTRDDRKEDEGA